MRELTDDKKLEIISDFIAQSPVLKGRISADDLLKNYKKSVADNKDSGFLPLNFFLKSVERASALALQ